MCPYLMVTQSRPRSGRVQRARRRRAEVAPKLSPSAPVRDGPGLGAMHSAPSLVYTPAQLTAITAVSSPSPSLLRHLNTFGILVHPPPYPTPVFPSPTTPSVDPLHVPCPSLAPAPTVASAYLLNTRSAVKHQTALFNLLTTDSPDFLFLTETWFTTDSLPDLLAILPDTYYALRADRPDGKVGGGVTMIIRSTLKFQLLNHPSILNVDYLVARSLNLSAPLTVVLVYRPPQSMPSFVASLQDLLATLVVNNSSVLLLGDFNYWPGDPREDLPLKDFSVTLQCLNLTPYVSVPTHVQGHTLDQIWSSRPIVSFPSISPCVWSDHFIISFSIHLGAVDKPPLPKNTLARNWNRTDLDSLSLSLVSSAPHLTNLPLESQVNAIGTWLSSSCDLVAPLRKIKAVRPYDAHKWFSPELTTLKLDLRRSERHWRRNYCPSLRAKYKSRLIEYKKAILVAKTAYFTERVALSANKSRKFFSLVHNLATSDRSTPSLVPSQSLCSSLNDFFIDKIVRIKANIPTAPQPCPTRPSPPPSSSLVRFPPSPLIYF
ncbi:uncharacterized protein LOC144805954 isoform X1 [Lissotriton helveticus]